MLNSRGGGMHHSLLSPGTRDFTHFHLHKKRMPRLSPNGGCGGFKLLVHNILGLEEISGGLKLEKQS